MSYKYYYKDYDDSLDSSDYDSDYILDDEIVKDKEFDHLCFLHSNIKNYCYNNLINILNKCTLSDLWDLKHDLYIFSEVKKSKFNKNRIRKLINTFNK